MCYKSIQELQDSVATSKEQNADPRKNSHPVSWETGTHSFKKTREPLQLAVGTTKTYTKDNFPLSIKLQAMPAVHRCESCKGEGEVMVGGKNYSVFNVFFYILTLLFGIIIHNIWKENVVECT